MAAAGAQERPESILPPGFGEPAQPSPTPTASSTPRTGSLGATVQPLPATPATGLPGDPAGPALSPTPTPTADPETVAQYALPDFARRPLSLVGASGPVQGGVQADAFGDADGRWIEALMRGLNGPIASRWMAITLRRALVSPLDTPANVNGADFAAERAWLLLRMGEAVAARAVVQGVDDDNYTPKLYQVAMQVALATGDPAALCPLVDTAAQRDPERAWKLAKPICVSLSGTPAAALPLLAAARRQHVANGIDYQLAQKVVGAGGQGRQAVTIEWDLVSQLTAWRYGLATATGVAIPDTLYATAGPQVAGWRALSPSIPASSRAAPADIAATTGVLSSAALVDLYASLNEAQDEAAGASEISDDLRASYEDPTPEARRAALGRLWGAVGTSTAYARLILTAQAAARVMPGKTEPDADRLIASMLSAGLDRTAGRWRDHVAEGSDAWAMLMLADPDTAGSVSYGVLSRYSGTGDAALKQRLLFAGLAGLGRLNPDDVERGAKTLEVRIGAENSWTRALDRAVRRGQPGMVVLLAAIGMQSPAWRGVPPEALYRIVDALRAAGLDGEARMIAAEAIARA
ncbi:hypothetical protein [uncultured Sphingomonas sp.]|uniref:hypothetical protein n=1 Tax=uncultured Sphingomonas sp. TaxID=158754 RepID=UPI0035C99918